MSRRRKGRITVQHQPTGAERAAVRMMGAVHAVFGIVFVIIALTQIIPSAGLFGAPFLAAGLFFAINGIRLVVSKNGLAHRMGYDVEDELEGEVIAPLTREPEPTAPESAPAGLHDHIPSTALSAQKRLEQLERLKEAGLLSQEEYRAKREEIIREL